MRVEEGFQLPPYVEGNPYTTDTVLPSLLKRLVPRDALPEITADLERFGTEVLTTVTELGAKAEEPKLVQYNHWGQRIDDLQTSEGWRGLKAKMQEEGIIGIFYERKHREFSRVHGFMKIVVSVGNADVIFCPLSMSDGSARVMELLGTPALQKEVYPRLISRDPQIAFTAGQWMTERPGGSDVSQTETVATAVPGASSPYGPVYSIDGFKWFSSATDSDVALALARTGAPDSGSRGLSLFLIPLRRPLLRPAGALRPSALTNNIKIHRLKNKVGTKLVPTAELSLEGTEAYLLGPLNQGVKLITPVLNITRIHSAVGSVGSIRRCLAIATAYSNVRAIRGGTQLLRDTPLHVAELARANLVYRALAHMAFGAVALLGKTECGVATKDDENMLRMLTPAVKAFAAEKASGVMEDCMTALGGQGYMEEIGLGTNLKDALVEKIWEGTITVLSLDIVRATTKPGVLQAFTKWANLITSSCPPALAHNVQPQLEVLQAAIGDIVTTYSTTPVPPLVPRPALFLYSYAVSAIYLLEHTSWAWRTGEPTATTDAEVFRRWVDEGGLQGAREDVKRMKAAGNERSTLDMNIVYGTGSTAKAHL